MGFIDIALSDAGEPEIVPEGAYDLRVAKFNGEARTAEDKPKLYALIVIEDGEHPDAAPIHLNMTVPDNDHPHKKFLITQIARFCQAFGIEYEDGGFNDEDVEGATANLFLSQVPDFRDPKVTVNEVQFPRLNSKKK